MGERVTVHIEIYLKKGKNSDTLIGYEVNIIFSFYLERLS